MTKTKVTIYQDNRYSLGNRYIYFYQIDNILYGQRMSVSRFSILPPQKGDEWKEIIQDEENFEDKIKQIVQDKFTFIKEAFMDIGYYYPRIVWAGYNYNQRNDEQAIQFFSAGKMLLEKLHQLSYIINPNPQNDLTYGHEVRSLFLLICMEIENNFVSTLKENGYIKERYSTADFIKLKDILNLDEIEIKFQNFPEYPSIKPFENWEYTKPTASLLWYDAYNATKHSREENFHKANFKNLMFSMAGLIVLLYAQFHTFPNDNILFKMNLIEVKFPSIKPEQIYFRHREPGSKLLEKKFFED